MTSSHFFPNLEGGTLLFQRNGFFSFAHVRGHRGIYERKTVDFVGKIALNVPININILKRY